MTAHFYLIAESFANNKQFTDEIIEDKVKRLSEDVTLIHKYRNANILYANYTELYPLVLYQTYTIEDFICTPHALKKNGVDRDIINSIQKILINLSEGTSITSDEVISDLLNWNDENDCHGIIAFCPIESLEENLQIIYGLDGWYKFRRHYLSKYPKGENFFLDECQKYFPNLYFHERNIETISNILHDFSGSIVRHLGLLNDKLFYYRNRDFENETIKYKTFSSECQLEEEAAPKDKNNSKEKLTFQFHTDEGSIISVTCYPHLRLCRSDKDGDTHYYYNRIYFHEGLESIKKNKILIGHIGEHL